MAPLVPDGVYKIRNVEFSRVVADLINGVRGGPIQGYIDRSSNVNDKFRIKNVGDGGNQVTIESVSTSGYYANVADQVQGAEIYGLNSSLTWTLVKVDVGFYIQAPDGYYVWQLTRDGDYAPIVLYGFTAQDNTKWEFEPVRLK